VAGRVAAGWFVFDVWWKCAAGGVDFDYLGFVHMVLVDVRAWFVSCVWLVRVFEVAGGGREGRAGRVGGFWTSRRCVTWPRWAPLS